MGRHSVRLRRMSRNPVTLLYLSRWMPDRVRHDKQEKHSVDKALIPAPYRIRRKLSGGFSVSDLNLLFSIFSINRNPKIWSKLQTCSRREKCLRKRKLSPANSKKIYDTNLGQGRLPHTTVLRHVALFPVDLFNSLYHRETL